MTTETNADIRKVSDKEVDDLKAAIENYKHAIKNWEVIFQFEVQEKRRLREGLQHIRAHSLDYAQTSTELHDSVREIFSEAESALEGESE